MKLLEDWVFSHYGQEVYTPGLERISRALAPLKKHLKSRIVTIAGTNGKGETTHRLSEHFKHTSFCAWTSPHIHSICERFSCEQGNISEQELTQLIQQCHQEVQAQRYQLSYYEFLFYVFCTWALRRQCEYLFLEVGLGGRLDAVNVMDAELVLLSSISRDHQEFLGNRLDSILQEKLGVLRPGATLMSFLELNYLRERARDYCQKLGVSWIDLQEKIFLPTFSFSERNQFLAYAAACHLQGKFLKASEWNASAEKLFSRGEVVGHKNQWWLFGSHNVDGMRKLIQLLHSANYNFKDRPFDAVITSFSKRSEKDIRVMLKMLKGAAIGEVLVTAFEHPKACPKDTMESLAIQEGLKFVEDINGHVQNWKNQKVLVAGSYYLLGKLRPLFCH